jgi:hypothetical protein
MTTMTTTMTTTTTEPETRHLDPLDRRFGLRFSSGMLQDFA